MRTMEERKREVMCRGKARIARRRRLTSTVCCCVLLAVVCVGGRYMANGKTPILMNSENGSSGHTANDGTPSYNVYGGCVDGGNDASSTMSVSVTGPDVVVRHTDAENIARITDAITAAKASAQPNEIDYTADGYANGNGSLPPTDSQTLDVTNVVPYYIHIGDNCYLLSPDKLTDITAGVYYELSEDVYEDLLAALRSSQTKGEKE